VTFSSQRPEATHSSLDNLEASLGKRYRIRWRPAELVQGTKKIRYDPSNWTTISRRGDQLDRANRDGEALSLHKNWNDRVYRIQETERVFFTYRGRPTSAKSHPLQNVSPHAELRIIVLCNETAGTQSSGRGSNVTKL
ncbi:hypothetical protein AVEN_105994-1, partial [Araneus ventricosus]